jgi:uroporphyrinogen decarboxylase
MTSRERFLTTIAFREPDRPPHFESMFELNQEAFGRDFPSEQAISEATGQERDRLLHECVEIYALIVERFKWDAVSIWRPWGGPQNRECLRIAVRELGGQVMVGGFLGGSVHAIDTVTDYVKFSVDLYEHPEELHAQAQQMADTALRVGTEMREVGADFVFPVSDVAHNGGPLLSPPMFREFVTPYLEFYMPKLKEQGLIVILHSDGDLMPVLEDFLAGGPHVLQSIDPMAGMDIAEVKRLLYGRVALMGNVQCSLMQDGPESAIRAEVRRTVAAGAPGGGYIFSTSNTIFPGMPLPHYEAMLDEFHELTGQAPGTSARV